MPNPFIALIGLSFQKTSKGGEKGDGVAGDKKIFSQSTAAALFLPIVFLRLAM